MHALRRVLEPSLEHGRASAYVEVTGEHVRLRPDVVGTLDITAFERALHCAGEPAADRRQHLRAALAQYRGHLLEDEARCRLGLPRREALRLERRQAALTLASFDTEAGEPLAAIGVLESLLLDDPGDECALRAMLRNLAIAGQPEEALRRYEVALARLREDLDVAPSPETQMLAHEIRTRRISPLEAAPSLAAGVRCESLPAPPNALIGRSHEIEELLTLLRTPSISLVTLTGPGGTGKTRLALEVARRAAPAFSAGVCFVSLARHSRSSAGASGHCARARIR